MLIITTNFGTKGVQNFLFCDVDEDNAYGKYGEIRDALNNAYGVPENTIETNVMHVHQLNYKGGEFVTMQKHTIIV